MSNARKLIEDEFPGGDGPIPQDALFVVTDQQGNRFQVFLEPSGELGVEFEDDTPAMMSRGFRARQNYTDQLKEKAHELKMTTLAQPIETMAQLSAWTQEQGLSQPEIQ